MAPDASLGSARMGCEILELTIVRWALAKGIPGTPSAMRLEDERLGCSRNAPGPRPEELQVFGFA